MALLGAAATFPSHALSQRSGPEASRVRRIGVLTTPAENDPLYKPRAAAMVEGLAALGWKAGDNLRVEWRYSGGDQVLLARYADELVALAPDALLAVGSPCVEVLRRRTRTIPIVFTIVTDPLGQGFVDSLSRPGGNIAGFTDFDLSMSLKWLQMLTEIAPPVATVGVLYNPATAPIADRMLQVVGEAASSRGVMARAKPVCDEAGIEAAAAALSREPRAGLLVLPNTFTIVNRAAIVRAAERARLPAVYWNRAFVMEGGLMSYGTDNNDLHRRSADYLARILNGADPGTLPVQYPTKFDLVINLKTAKTLGVEVAPALLAAVDEVIE